MRRNALLFLLFAFIAVVIHDRPALAASFVQDQKLTAADFTVDTPLNAPDAQYGDAVAVAGNWMAVGAPEANAGQGAVFIYEYVAGSWTYRTLLTGLAQVKSEFGGDVAIYESGGTVTVVAGAPLYDGANTDEGRTMVFVGNGVTFGTQVVLTPTSAETNGQFGSSVALWGDTAVIGEPFDGVSDHGAVSIRSRNQGGSNAWGQIASQTGPSASSGFGTAVDAHGEYVLVGAPYADNASAVSAGRAYLYRQDFGGANFWGLAHTLDAGSAQADMAFGFSVGVWDINTGTAASGSRNIVGAPLWDNTASFPDSGAVYFFNDGTQNASFSLIATATNSYANYGYSVALEGADAIAGRPGQLVSGSARVGQVNTFTYNGTVWVTNTINLTQIGAAAGYYFGWSTDLSGTLAVTGAPGTRSDDLNLPPGASRAGTITTFAKPGVTWAFASVLKPTFDLPSVVTFDYFASSIAYTDTWMAVGVAGDDQKGVDAGAVYLYQNVGGVWTPHSKLTGLYSKAGDYFGGAVALDGTRLVVGASGFDGFPTNTSNTGAIYVYDYTGSAWRQTLERTSPTPVVNEQFGISVAIDGDVIVVGANETGGGTGHAYVYQNATLTSPVTLAGNAAGDQFGYSVAVYDPAAGTANDETIVVGAPNKDGNTGAAYAFTGSGYSTKTTLASNSPASGDLFGQDVAVYNGRIAVGASGSGTNGEVFVFSGSGFTTRTPVSGTGASAFGFSVAMDDAFLLVGAPETGNGRGYIFSRSGDNWTEIGFLNPADLSSGDKLGRAVALNNGSFAISAPLQDVSGNNDAGAAYVFSLAPEVVVDPTALTLAEEGATSDTFLVTLNQTPVTDVTFTLTFDANIQVNTGSGLGASPQTVTLNSSNWNSGVTVTVKAVDDSIDEDDPHTTTITTSVTDSATVRFDGIAVADVTVNISDNDTAGVTITQSGGTNEVTEDGDTDTYTIELDTQPTSTVNVAITFPATDLTVNGDTDGTYNTTFTTANWNTAQTITVGAVNDRNFESDHSGTLTHAFTSADGKYNGVTALVDTTTSTNALGVAITDNETIQLVWQNATGSGPENDSGFYTQNVVYDIVPDPASGATPVTEVSIGFETGFVFNGSAEAADVQQHLISVTRNPGLTDGATDLVYHTFRDDTLVEGDETFEMTLALTTPMTGASVGTNHVATITDADTATVAISGGTLVSEAVGTTDLTVTLTTSGATLANDVTIPVNLVNDTAVYNGSTGDMYLAGPANTTNVTFAEGAGNTATQTVTVSINNDQTVEASPASSTGFNANEKFDVTLGTPNNGVTVTTGTTTVTIDENDFAYITMNPTFSVNDATDIESNTSRSVNVTVRIVSDGTGTVQVQDAFTVPVQTAGLGQPNDATSGADYTAVSTTVSFPALSANNAQQPVPLTIVNDSIDEYYGALSAFNQNREFFDVGFSSNAIRATYAGVPILIPQSANDNCDGTGGLPNLSGTCRDRSTIIILDDDSAGVTVTEIGGNTSVTEGGATDSYSIVLTSQPTANVTINMAYEQAQVSLNGDSDGSYSVTFTTANWNTPQPVTVTAVDDTIVEANPHTSPITQTLTSSDTVYNTINPADVTVSITDNDTATIVFTNPTGTAAETTSSYSATARLDLVTNGVPGGTLASALTANVNVTLGSAESTDFTQDTTQVTFGAGSANAATQPINFTITNDRLLEGGETFVLTYTLASGTGTVSGAHTVTITDDESGAITFVQPSSTASEGTTPHNVGVQLAISGTGSGNVQVESAVSVVITNPAGTASTPDDYTVTTSNVTFAAGTDSPISGTIANTIVNDSLVEAEDETFTLGFGTVTGSGTLSASGTHVVTIDENDTATIAFSAGNDTVGEAVGTFNKTVTLTITSNPDGGTLAADVVIPYGADELSALEPEDYTLVGTTITFPEGSGNGFTLNAQVNIVNDQLDEDSEFFEPHLNNNNLALSTNVTLTRALTTVQITDDDTSDIIVNPTTLAVDETGPTSMDYTVVLGSQPTANVTVNMTFDPAQITLNGETDGTHSITFTTADWNTAQTLTVEAVDDAVNEGDHSTPIVQTASSGDSKYNVVNPADVLVNITDNDVPGVELVVNSDTLDESDTATTASYSVRLTSQPTQNVTITATFDPAQVTVNGETDGNAELTFVPAGWNTPQDFVITVIDDNIDESATTYTTLITNAVSSADPNYASAATAPFDPTDEVTLTITDNDVAAVTQNPTSITVSEAGATAQYTIAASTQPTDDVTVTLTFDSAQIRVDGQLSPYVVTLTPTDFSVDVTVSAVNDDVDETDPHSVTITHAIASVSDPFYNALPDDATVNVDINDNDTAQVVVSTTALTTNEGDVTPTTFTVQLNSQPTAGVTVTLTFDNQITVNGEADGSVDVVFDTTNWNQAQTVNVLAVNDAVDETDPHFSGININATSNDDLYDNTDFDVVFVPDNAISVTIGDNDVAGVNITENSGTANDNNITIVENGAAGSFNVVLNSQPTASVEVSMTFNDTIIQAGSPTVGGTPVVLTFDNTNWNQPQTVNVSAINDDIDQDDRTTNISVTVGSTDGFYVAAPVTPASPVVVNITEDDVAGLVFLDSEDNMVAVNTVAATVTEDFALLSSDAYKVRLNSQPQADVTITLTFDSTFVAIPDGTAQGIQINGLGSGDVTLTFTAADWNTAQDLTVKAYEDFVDETPDPKPYPVTHTITTGDAQYTAFGSAAVNVNVNDGITAAPNGFDLVSPVNNLFILDTNLANFTTMRWTDPVNAVTFDVTVDQSGGTADILPALKNLTRAADADNLTCDGTTCTLTIGAAEQALLTNATYTWSVMAESPLGSTASNQTFKFTIGSATQNLVRNGGFEIAGTTAQKAKYWNGKLLSPNNDRRMCSAAKPVGYNSNCAFRFSFNGTVVNTVNRYLRQTINNPAYGISGDTVILSAQVKAKNLVKSGRLEVLITYADGTKSRARVGIQSGTYGYRLRQTQALTLTGHPTKIQVTIAPLSTKGTFYIDEVALTLTPGTEPNNTPTLQPAVQIQPEPARTESTPSDGWLPLPPAK